MSAFLSFRGHAYLCLAARLYLGTIFLAACVHKIIHPEMFAVDIATYQILPLSLVNLTAVILPWIELGAGVLLIVGYRTRAAALLIAGMMFLFTLAIVIALQKGLDMSCGCFASQGAEQDPISIRTVFRDLGWLALSLYVLIVDVKPIGFDGWLMRRRLGTRIKTSPK